LRLLPLLEKLEQWDDVVEGLATLLPTMGVGWGADCVAGAGKENFPQNVAQERFHKVL
jgi:hypothetical protein